MIWVFRPGPAKTPMTIVSGKTGNCQHHVDDAHQDGIGSAAQVSGGDPEQGADGGETEQRIDTDEQ